MSSRMVQNKIETLQRDLNRLYSKLADEEKKEADKNARIQQIRKSITKNTSTATLQSKLREVERLESDIVSIQKKKTDISQDIARKVAAIVKQQQLLTKEKEKEQKKNFDNLKRQGEVAEQKYNELINQLNMQSSQISVDGSGDTLGPSYNVFISHASEDKEELVRPLAKLLIEAGFEVWYDEFQLKVGDSLRRSIDRGLASSKFGIVVLSPAFFSKNWPQYELDGLVARELQGTKVILPLWHKVSQDEVISYSPSLADKLALNTSMYTLEELVAKLAEVLS